MEYFPLGRTGLKISQLGLGCGSFGGLGSDPRFFGMGQSEAEAFALMDSADEMGINFFDTADSYGGGRSESIIGRWFKTKSSEVRQQILVSSKVFNPIGDGPNDRGLSRRHILRQVDSSLKRLGVERLDLYLAHEVDAETPLEETLRAFDDVIRQGKAHYIGASNWEAWRLARALWVSDKLGIASFSWIQNSYNLLEQELEYEMLPLCHDQGLGFTPYSSLGGGWLTGKYEAGKNYPAGSRMTMRPEPYQHLIQEKTFRGVGAFRKAATSRGIDMATLAFAWVLSHPQTNAVIIGPRRPEHFELAEKALRIPLTAIERAELAALFR